MNITNLVDQAILLSDEHFHSSNIEVVKTILQNNCYPFRIINKQIKERLKIIKNNRMTTSSKSGNSIDNSKVLVVPYVSNDIKRIVKNFVDVWYTIPKKLDSIIRKGKDSLKDY